MQTFQVLDLPEFDRFVANPLKDYNPKNASSFVENVKEDPRFFFYVQEVAKGVQRTDTTLQFDVAGTTWSMRFASTRGNEFDLILP